VTASLPHGEPSHSTQEADLFSTASLREPPSPAVDPPPKAPSTTDVAAEASTPRYLLPKDLAGAISNLSDQEFDRLLAGLANFCMILASIVVR
jgi:hypothetical protein